MSKTQLPVLLPVLFSPLSIEVNKTPKVQQKYRKALRLKNASASENVKLQFYL